MAVEEDFDPRGAIDSLRANLEQPDKFAELFCNAAAKQKSIDNVLKDIVRELLKHDKETVERIKTIQKEVNKDDWKTIIKKIGVSGWSILLLIIGALISGLSRKYFG
ncbi:TPA: hypothetical protein RJD83_000280 [Legionella pneumophila]|nr:hypothetical protein [Legionella pneumophila]